uniref:Transmembrane and coiled-coil domain-containing protein 4 n=1 Tax=Cacopsylla melanoneura TaxID=428564 RepID=A0A8D8ZQY6_9HEMI
MTSSGDTTGVESEPMEVDCSIMQPTDETEDKYTEPVVLSDAAKFSCAALCALSLNHLFNNEWDETFNRQCIQRVVTYLQLPQQVLQTMYELMKADFCQGCDAYIALIKAEANLCSILHSLVALAVNQGFILGEYDARWRVLIQYMSRQMQVDIELVETFENDIAEKLSLQHEHQLTLEEEQGAKSRRIRTLAKRYAWISLATIGGGALVGVTGGLAAPFIGAGLGSLIGGSAAMALGSTTGIAVVGSLFGAAGAGLTGFKMHKRVGDIEQFEIKEFKSPTGGYSKPLHISIAIHGWLSDETDESFIKPWTGLEHSKEQYYLCYESRYLVELGKAMEYIYSFAVSMATQEALKYTILSGIISAIAWPSSLLALSSVIDNPWGVCCRRAVQVGKQLAEILLTKTHGNRPVTLIGYSLGARVIFYCLREMSTRNCCEGIIQDVVLIGAPCSGNRQEWSKFTKVVAGRIVNGYSRSDWLLKFLYRTLSMPSGGVAGLQKIPLEDRRMCNVDLTDIVLGHSEYPQKMTQILDKVGIKTIKAHMRRSQTQPYVQVLTENLRQTKSEECLSTFVPTPSPSQHFTTSTSSLDSLHITSFASDPDK